MDPIRENCVLQSDEEKCDLVYRLIVSKLDEIKDTGIYRCNFISNGWIVDTAAIKVNKILGKFIDFKIVFKTKITLFFSISVDLISFDSQKNS